MICFDCGRDISIQKDGRIGRGDECPHCGADMHVCMNCQHYDSKSYNECREPAAEVVKEKDRSNFCDHFTPRTGSAGPGASDKDKLRAAAEALFKKK